MLPGDIWFTLYYIQTSSPDPTFVQCLRKGIRIDQSSSSSVHQHACALHLLQNGLADNVFRRTASWRKYEQHITLARELVQSDTSQAAKTVLRAQRIISLRVICGRIWVSRVQAICDSERYQSREGCLRNASETQESHNARGIRCGRADLLTAERKWRPSV